VYFFSFRIITASFIKSAQTKNSAALDAAL